MLALMQLVSPLHVVATTSLSKVRNVQSLTIGQKGKVEISDTLVSVINDKAATTVADRTLTIDASDVHVGRTYELKIDNADAQSPAVTVTVTAASGETAASLATKLRCSACANVKYRDGLDANNISVSSNVITFNHLQQQLTSQVRICRRVKPTSRLSQTRSVTSLEPLTAPSLQAMVHSSWTQQ